MITDTEVKMLQRISTLLLAHMDMRRRRMYGDKYVNENPTHANMINCGDCFNWAIIAYFVFGDRITLHSVGNFGHHAFIGIGKLFYDSNNIYGVEKWRDISAGFLQYRDVPDDRVFHTQSFDDFVEWWVTLGASNVELDAWENIADQVRREFIMAEAA